MKKRPEVLPLAADGSIKLKTINNKKNIVLLAFTERYAVLYQKYEGRPASVIRKGDGDRFASISNNCSISVARFTYSDFAIIVSSLKMEETFRLTEEFSGEQKGALLFYSKPGSGSIHVRIVCSRISDGYRDSFVIKEKADLWMLKSLFEPLAISHGIRFNWVRFLQAAYDRPIIIKNFNERGVSENEFN